MKYISTAFGILGKTKRRYSKASTKICYAKIVNLIVDKYMKIYFNSEIKEEDILILKNELYNRLLKKGKLYATDIKEKGLMSYYHPITGDIHIKNTMSNKIDNRSLIHEVIHKIGPNIILNRKYIGILEGATESIVTSLFSNTSKLCKIENIYFYLESSTYYPYQVLIVRQMDYMLNNINKINKNKNINNMVENSILNRNMDFKNKFIKIYGKKLFNCINKFCNFLLKEHKSSNIESINDKFINLQNIMLTKCFDLRFIEILNKNNAVQDDYFEYLIELKKFEYLRAIKEEDEYFEKYYIDKYMKIEKICIEENLGIDKIEKHRTMVAKFN